MRRRTPLASATSGYVVPTQFVSSTEETLHSDDNPVAIPHPFNCTPFRQSVRATIAPVTMAIGTNMCSRIRAYR